MGKPAFQGFSLAMLHFLEELARNNDRAWFTRNKERYEEVARTPALEFISAMAKPLASISPHFVAAPKKVGGSLMRIHRDVRFSADKAPYKTNLGIHFRHEAGKDVHAPGFYVHIGLDECFLGAGIWRPDAEALAAIRERMVAEPARWKRARGGKRFTEVWSPSGDSLKRPPRGYDANHPLIDDLKRKDHIGMAPLSHDDLLAEDLVERAIAAFKRSKLYMGFLCDAVGVDF